MIVLHQCPRIANNHERNYGFHTGFRSSNGVIRHELVVVRPSLVSSGVERRNGCKNEGYVLCPAYSLYCYLYRYIICSVNFLSFTSQHSQLSSRLFLHPSTSGDEHPNSSGLHCL